jgi:TonB family protein
MSTGTSPVLSLQITSKRRVPRYKLNVPLDLTVLRSGIPDSIPGRTLEIGEGGLGVVAASQLLLGESVRVEFLLPHTNLPVRATAVVRYQCELYCGLQFLRLPAEQQSIIRYWTRCEGALSLAAPDNHSQVARSDDDLSPVAEPLDPTQLEKPSTRSHVRRVLALGVPVLLLAGALQWWHWRQEWSDLEVNLSQQESATGKPPLVLPAEVMQARFTHKVQPVYPELARRAGVHGSVMLDVIVDQEGLVTEAKVVSGPEALSSAALDAVRWWRFEPYVVDGHAVSVKSTLALEFRL